MSARTVRREERAKAVRVPGGAKMVDALQAELLDARAEAAGARAEAARWRRQSDRWKSGDALRFYKEALERCAAERRDFAEKLGAALVRVAELEALVRS